MVFTEELLHKYGEKIVFVGRLLPVVRTYISLPAGIGRTNFSKFIIYTLAGSLIWNSVLTLPFSSTIPRLFLIHLLSGSHMNSFIKIITSKYLEITALCR